MSMELAEFIARACSAGSLHRVEPLDAQIQVLTVASSHEALRFRQLAAARCLDAVSLTGSGPESPWKR
jgi:hypothetical protein